MRITLYGWYNYDNTLFDDVTLPDGIDKQYVIDEIFARSGDLYTYHQQPVYLKKNITNWFNRNYEQFEKMIAALTADYDPIENYDRTESETTKPGVTTTHTNTGTDVVQNSGKDVRDIESSPASTMTTTSSRAANDSSSYQPVEQTATTGSGKDTSKDTFTNGLKVENTHGHVLTETVSGYNTRTLHVHGNIGTMTNQKMVNDEIELRKFDIYRDIARRFEHEFLICIY